MAGSVDMERHGRVGHAGRCLGGILEQSAGLDSERHLLLVYFDGGAFDPGEIADQGGAHFHRAADIAGADLPDRIDLRSARLVVDDQPDGPIAARHWAIDRDRNNEGDAAKVGIAGRSVVNAHHNGGNTGIVGRLRLHVGVDARAKIIAIAGLEILAGNAPVRSSHDAPYWFCS